MGWVLTGRVTGVVSTVRYSYGMVNPEDRPDESAVAELMRALPEEWREEPLGWPGVLEWEAEHGVVLPEPYRTLIAQIANGCALGPPEDGGLLPLGWLLPGADDQGERDPAAPFPLAEAWYWELDPAPAILDGLDNPILATSHNGSVLLGTEGMEDWILLTAGPLRGRVWILCEFGACPFTRPGMSAEEAQGTGFLDWVSYWSSLAGRPLLADFTWPQPFRAASAES